MVKKSSILLYARRAGEAIEILESAKELVAEQREPYLAYTVAGSLADAHLRAGDYPTALDRLQEAKALYAKVDHPPGWCEVQAVEGFIRHGLGQLDEAEELCLEARLGFIAEGDTYSVALVDIDLAQLYARQDDWGKVAAFSSEAVPLLGNLRLHEETLAAVALLADAIEAGQVAPQLLQDVRRRLEQDPLARLPQPSRAGNLPAL